MGGYHTNLAETVAAARWKNAEICPALPRPPSNSPSPLFISPPESPAILLASFPPSVFSISGSTSLSSLPTPGAAGWKLSGRTGLRDKAGGLGVVRNGIQFHLREIKNKINSNHLCGRPEGPGAHVSGAWRTHHNSLFF